MPVSYWCHSSNNSEMKGAESDFSRLYSGGNYESCIFMPHASIYHTLIGQLLNNVALSGIYKDTEQCLPRKMFIPPLQHEEDEVRVRAPPLIEHSGLWQHQCSKRVGINFPAPNHKGIQGPSLPVGTCILRLTTAPAVNSVPCVSFLSHSKVQLGPPRTILVPFHREMTADLG